MFTCLFNSMVQVASENICSKLNSFEDGLEAKLTLSVTTSGAKLALFVTRGGAV
jgi:hypothetical protein